MIVEIDYYHTAKVIATTQFFSSQEQQVYSVEEAVELYQGNGDMQEGQEGCFYCNRYRGKGASILEYLACYQF